MKLDSTLANLITIAGVSPENLRAIVAKDSPGTHRGETFRDVMTDDFIGKALRHAEPRLLAMNVMLTNEDELSIIEIRIAGLASNDDGDAPGCDITLDSKEGKSAAYTIKTVSNGSSIVEMVSYNRSTEHSSSETECFFSTYAMGNCIRRELRAAIRTYDVGSKAPQIVVTHNAHADRVLDLLKEGRFGEAFDLVDLDEVYRDTMRRSIEKKMPDLEEYGGIILSNRLGMTDEELYGDSVSTAFRGKPLGEVIYIPKFLEGLTVGEISFESEDCVHMTIDYDFVEAATRCDLPDAA